MGHSQKDKEKTHAVIVEIAAQKMRESGTEGPGVAEIMKAAEAAVAQARDGFAEVTEGVEDPLAAFVDWYLSPAHRDQPGTGCAVVALGADAARADERVRAVYRGQVERYIAQMEELLGGEGEDARRRAIAAVSTMVGALLIARAVGDEALSEEILREARTSVEAGPKA
jgi:TetR/AcrR family transcriptional repressor of nem operon